MNDIINYESVPMGMQPDDEVGDVIKIGNALQRGGFRSSRKTFDAVLRVAAMGACSVVSARMSKLAPMTRDEFMLAAGRAYDWATSRKRGE